MTYEEADQFIQADQEKREKLLEAYRKLLTIIDYGVAGGECQTLVFPNGSRNCPKCAANQLREAYVNQMAAILIGVAQGNDYDVDKLIERVEAMAEHTLDFLPPGVH